MLKIGKTLKRWKMLKSIENIKITNGKELRKKKMLTKKHLRQSKKKIIIEDTKDEIT